MCSLTAAGLAVTAVSTAVGMYAQHQQQSVQESAAKAQAVHGARLEAEEAATRRQLAQNELGKSINERERHAREALRRQGQLAGMLGSSGFALDSGSALSLLAEQMEEEQHTANSITRDGNMAAYQQQAAAVDALNRKSMFDYRRAEASSGRTGSMLGMGNTLLSGLGSGIRAFGR